MPDNIFRSGYLSLPNRPSICDILPPEWGDLLTNRIMVVISVCMVLLLLIEYLNFAPTALYCLKRASGSINLEHSISLARTRNLLALVMVMPFCLVIDFSGLIPKSHVPACWSAPATIGLLLAYLLIRFITFRMCFLERSLSTDASLAAHKVIYTVFIALTVTMLPTIWILVAVNAGETLMRLVIIIETGLFYALSFVRTGQILATGCNVISTILYLCALEIVPTGLLVVSVLYF